MSPMTTISRWGLFVPLSYGFGSFGTACGSADKNVFFFYLILAVMINLNDLPLAFDLKYRSCCCATAVEYKVSERIQP